MNGGNQYLYKPNNGTPINYGHSPHHYNYHAQQYAQYYLPPPQPYTTPYGVIVNMDMLLLLHHIHHNIQLNISLNTLLLLHHMQHQLITVMLCIIK